MTYQAIKEMRLNHGNRCTEPPNGEPKIQAGWKFSSLDERASIPALTEHFNIFLSGEMHATHVPE